MNETAQFGPEPLASGVEKWTGTPTPKPKRVGAGGLISCMLAAGVLGGGTVAAASTLFSASSPAASAVQSAEFTPVIVNNPDSVNAVTAAAQKATPSVVTISATSANSGGTGSGIILDADGDILTNMHVVTLDGAAANAVIEVRTSNGKVYSGTVVGTDALADLAVVKIDAEGLVPADLGDSAKVNVGDTAIAIGAPLGLSGTVTDGIVSAANRTIETASSATPSTQSRSATATQASISTNVIQTDAAINPGNSGGALVNTKGQVIGVNVAIASADSSSSSTQSGNIGVGFLIPINEASRVAQEIIAKGSATHGQLGISVQDMASGTSSEFTAGAKISAVTAGSGAASAGLKAGDVVTGLAGRSITDASELIAAAHEHAAGTTVKVTYQRDGKEASVDVVLGSATAG
ncbi:putative serine protease PepD [Arthrobacter sp. B3I9]|uniref:S1C family serine protease n=1 Tax=Arthrobacter sp. B3I9 TaxID=3042270 RepID=UPI002790FBB2|nr:trypsin-like peptidase domain-containing protein [Arthrobacter sp. B3I9]MDQ0851101.1 putative serine protease PepD [Arthrobacter sp. B3I9]